jgi:methylmalonyl-CoA epimerase
VRVTRIDQIAVVVYDLEAALGHYERQYGLTPHHRERLEDAQIEEAMIDVGGVWLQLIQPTSPDSVVAAFLAEHGPGLHHLGFGVASMDEALEHLRSAGAELREPAPRRGGGGHTIAFVEPDPVVGVLVELVQNDER